jgi:membrane protein
MRLREAWELIRDSILDWNNDNATMLGAALSFFTIFSLAPLLLIAIAIAGLAFGERAARGEIVGQIQNLIGQQSAGLVQEMLVHINKPQANILAAVLGLAILLLGASGVFLQLQSAMNIVWKVRIKRNSGVRVAVRQRLLSFSIVAATGFLLLVSLLISAILSALDSTLRRIWPGSTLLLWGLGLLISLTVIAGVFAMIFKVLPDAKIRWGDVWIGAFVTSVLFNLGRFLIGLYLGNSGVASTYGAAASLVIILLWVYYSALILFLGAEFTQVYARRYGQRIEPANYAELLPGHGA